jgi:hypothetical protein
MVPISSWEQMGNMVSDSMVGDVVGRMFPHREFNPAPIDAVTSAFGLGRPLGTPAPPPTRQLTHDEQRRVDAGLPLDDTPQAVPGPSELDAEWNAMLEGDPSQNLDRTITAQGMPFPAFMGGGGVSAPHIPAPPQMPLADFTEADRALEAARPKNLGQEGESELDGVLAGLAQAASQTGPDTALSQMILNLGAGMLQGATTARSANRKDQIAAERERARYEMEVAGWGAKKAQYYAEAKAKQLEMEWNVIQQNVENEFRAAQVNASASRENFGYQTKLAEMSIPEVRYLDDGSAIITEFDPATGVRTTKREGADEADAIRENIKIQEAMGASGPEQAAQTWNLPNARKELRLANIAMQVSGDYPEQYMGKALPVFTELVEKEKQKAMMAGATLDEKSEARIKYHIVRRMLDDPRTKDALISNIMMKMKGTGPADGQ